MTAEAHHWRNTLRWSTNGDFFRTLSQQWALSPDSDIEAQSHELFKFTTISMKTIDRMIQP